MLRQRRDRAGVAVERLLQELVNLLVLRCTLEVDGCTHSARLLRMDQRVLLQLLQTSVAAELLHDILLANTETQSGCANARLGFVDILAGVEAVCVHFQGARG